MKMFTHWHTHVKSIFVFIKCTRCMHAHLQTHNILYPSILHRNHSGWVMVSWMCLWSRQMVLVTFSPNFTWYFHEGAQSQNTWHWNRPSADSSDVLSCGAWTSSGLQTAEVCLPQHSVDVVVGDTAAVAMETMLQRAGRVFRLWARRALWEAVALVMWARTGPYQ